jgi:hypothetical protein
VGLSAWCAVSVGRRCLIVCQRDYIVINGWNGIEGELRAVVVLLVETKGHRDGDWTV